MRQIVIAALLALLSVSYGSARAKTPDTALWKKVNGWYIYIDKTVGYQCFIANIYEDLTVFRMGFQKPSSATALYIAIGNKNWQSLEDGKDYPLVMQVDNEKPWNSPASAAHIGKMPFLIVNTSQIQFVSQILRKHGLKVFFNGENILNLSLRGSAGALQEMVNCQRAVNEYLGQRKPASKDPFSGASNTRPKKDPFATY